MNRRGRRLGRRLGRAVVAAVVAASAAIFSPRGLTAQAVERPVSFDLDGRVLVITPPLVARLGLTPPDWIVPDGFIEARLYATGDSAFVLVVRRGELVERYPLTSAQREVLARRIADAAALTGRPVQELAPQAEGDRGAGTRFAVGQTVLGAFVYGPGLALAVERPEAYFVGLAGGFFAGSFASGDASTTDAQAGLSNQLGGRFAGAVALIGSAMPEPTARGIGAALLAGGITGSVAGYAWGRHLTTAEVAGIGWGSSSVAAFGLLASGAFRGVSAETRSLATGSGLLLGIPLGLAYARTSSYVLSTGDLLASRVPQGIAATLGWSLTRLGGQSSEVASLVGTLGFLGGVVIGDRFMAKPYDYSVTQASLLSLGTGVTGFAAWGIARPETSDRALAIFAAGGLLGALVTHATFDLRPAGRRSASRDDRHIRFDPLAVVGAATRSPGVHPILSIQFR